MSSGQKRRADRREFVKVQANEGYTMDDVRYKQSQVKSEMSAIPGNDKRTARRQTRRAEPSPERRQQRRRAVAAAAGMERRATRRQERRASGRGVQSHVMPDQESYTRGYFRR